MKTLGLIGRNISYSFSRAYFQDKFQNMNISDFEYVNFDLQNLNQIQNILKEEKNFGFNVTIPYKEAIIPYLDELDIHAKKIGAVNTIKKENGKTIGYNTDWIGFKKTLTALKDNLPQKALVLGTGGASKAIIYALKELKIDYLQVSRSPNDNQISYCKLNKDILNEYLLLINCTPTGTYPHINESPNIPYSFITKHHILYDLIYNPETTQFLKNGKEKGATTLNGYQMLVKQAEESWEIWKNFK